MAFQSSTAKQIIDEGDVSVLVSAAQQIGNDLARQLTTNQIRNVFGEVRQIEMSWPKHRGQMSLEDQAKADNAYRRVVLLRPKLAYQARKERGRGVEELKEVLDPCLEQIQKANGHETRRLYFERFVDFFEAILAYHKSAGGN